MSENNSNARDNTNTTNDNNAESIQYRKKKEKDRRLKLIFVIIACLLVIAILTVIAIIFAKKKCIKGDKGDTGLPGEKGDPGPKGVNGCTIMYFKKTDKPRIDFFIDSDGDGKITGNELNIGPFASATYDNQGKTTFNSGNLNSSQLSQLLGLTDINDLHLDQEGWGSITEHTV